MNSIARTEKISVCMATYNGSRFVVEQITSILSQINSGDELVIVDDCSTDSTLNFIRAFSDTRIRLAQNPTNLGVTRSFERALQLASGSTIFLSDQDDVWHPDRVRLTCDAFAAAPDVTLLMCAISFIGVDGHELSHSSSASSTFRGGILPTLIKNSYQGCAMAFRRTVLEAALPFPPNIPMHDSWIGLVNSLVGRAQYLNALLVCYRRHELNATGIHPLSFSKRISGRWALFSNLLKRSRLLATRRAAEHAAQDSAISGV